MTMSAENVVERIPIWRGKAVGRIEEIQGGWTNRDFRVDVNDDRYVVRLNGEGTSALGIDRRREYEIARLAGEMGIAPNVVYFSEAEGVMVTEFVDGRHLSFEEVARPETLRRLARALRQIHAPQAGDIKQAIGTATFCPFERATQWLRAAERLGAAMPKEFASLEERMGPVRGSAYSRPFPSCLCHNDVVLGNIFDSGDLKVVDWELAGMGNPLYDLATLAVNGRLSAESETILLDAYFEAAPAPEGTATHGNAPGLMATGGDAPDLIVTHGSAPDRSVLVPWKRAFDFINGAYYLVQSAVSRRGLDYPRGVKHHFSRLARDMAAD